MPDSHDALLVGGVLGRPEGGGGDGAVVLVHDGVAALVEPDPVALPAVGLVGLGVDVQLVARGHDEPLTVVASQGGQDGAVGVAAVPDQDEVLVRFHVEVLDLQGDDLALAGRDHVQALEAAGVLPRVVRASHDLGLQGGSQIAATRLSLRPPRSPESPLLHAAVGHELDHHEVGRGDEAPRAEVQGAAEGGHVDGGPVGPAAAQDVDGVEVLLGVELAELEHDVRTPGALQGPLAVGEGLVLAGVVGGLDDVAGALQVEGAVLGAVELVAVVAAVVLAVAEELSVDALAVGAVEGSAWTGFDATDEGHQGFAGSQLPFLVEGIAAHGVLLQD